MKGVKIIKAQPGNILDVYELFCQMQKEGFITYPKASPEQLKEYYFTLLEQLKNPFELFLLARRGRSYYGYAHGSLVVRPFGEPRVLHMNTLYITKNKRRLGVGQALADEVGEILKSVGVSTVEFMCQDNMREHFEKKFKAKKVLNLMHMVVGR